MFFSVISVLLIIGTFGAIIIMVHDLRLMKKYNRIYDLVMPKVIGKKLIPLLLFASGISCPLSAYLAFAASQTDWLPGIPHIPFVVMSVCFGVIFVLFVLQRRFMKRYNIIDRGGA